MVASVHWGLSVRYTMLIIQTQSQRVSANYNSGPNYTSALLIIQAVQLNLSLVMVSLSSLERKRSRSLLVLTILLISLF